MSAFSDFWENFWSKIEAGANVAWDAILSLGKKGMTVTADILATFMKKAAEDFDDVLIEAAGKGIAAADADLPDGKYWEKWRYAVEYAAKEVGPTAKKYALVDITTAVQTVFKANGVTLSVGK